MNNLRPTDQWVMSYKDLRKAVGLIGILLPVLLILGKMAIEWRVSVAGSISGYYFTVVGSLFVGSMCAIGVFLMFYRGPERVDNIAGYIAGINAIGVGLFPTKPDPVTPATYQTFPSWVAILHLVFAGIFFLSLAYFCLVLFVKTHPGMVPTGKKKLRNRIYRVCGYTVLMCLVLILAAFFFMEEAQRERFAVFLVLESVAVFAFGVAWLVKGEAVFADS